MHTCMYIFTYTYFYLLNEEAGGKTARLSTYTFLAAKCFPDVFYPVVAQMGVFEVSSPLEISAPGSGKPKL